MKNKSENEKNMKCKLFFCVALLLFATLLQAQSQTAAIPDTSQVNTRLREIKAMIGQDPARGLEKAKEVKALSEKIRYPVGVATATKLMGNAAFYLGQPENALLYWQDALKKFEDANDKIGQADLLGNIGIFYYHRGNEIKALEHHLKSLKIAESINYKPAMASAMNNIGGVYYMKEATYDKALKYYLMALPLCEELGNRDYAGTITVNLGNIYMNKNEDQKALAAFNKSLRAYEPTSPMIPNVYRALGGLYLKLKEYDKALNNYQYALEISRKADNRLDIAKALIGKASVYSKEGDYKTAIGFYKQAESIVSALNATLEFERLYEEMATAYANTGDYNNAYLYHTYFSKVKDTLYNNETDKRLATLQFDFDLQKKQNQINLLTKDKSIKELELKKQETFKNALFTVVCLIFVVAVVLFRGYRNKVKTNIILDRKNMEIERLILNILPAEVAHELRTTGKATPRNYEYASVLFTDFKDFTSLTRNMPPDEVVKELNACFVAFDEIVGVNNLEKIKTIGDAYMCAGGIPTFNKNHVFDIVEAGLAMQDCINKMNERRAAAGLPPWEARIGIHVGPLVAGVVGKKKYAYDIWGSTVNIASRIETNGVPGHVNVSEAVYQVIKDRYNCIYRGKIHAKNVGEIDMYLINHKHETFEEAKDFSRKEKENVAEKALVTKLYE